MDALPFTEAIRAWAQLRRERDPGADAYYARYLLPEVARRFRASVAQAGAAYRGLVLVGSGQPDTAALLIDALDPERVAILLTDQTRGDGRRPGFAEQVQQRLAQIRPDWPLRCPPEGWLMTERDHATTLATYQGLDDVLRAWPDLPRTLIAVDLTGGKSTMTVGMAKAAYLLDLPSVYIESESDPDLNIPIPGTQRFERPPDPYAVFGDIERRRAGEIFNRYDYAEAAEVFRRLAQAGAAPQADRADRAWRHTDDAFWAGVADAYAAWDGFDLRAAMARLSRLTPPAPLVASLAKQQASLALVQRLVGIPRPERNRRETWGAVSSYLAAMERFAAQQLALLQERDAGGRPLVIPALLAMLYANGLRRAAQDRLDTATMLLYRCLELMSQQQLALQGVLTEWARDSLQRLAQRHPRLQHVTAVEKRAGTVALGVSYEILKLIDDPFARQVQLQQLREAAEIRNQSLLAHGFSFISRDDYQAFRAVVDATIGVWCAIHQIDWGAALATATFCAYPDS